MINSFAGSARLYRLHGQLYCCARKPASASAFAHPPACQQSRVLYITVTTPIRAGPHYARAHEQYCGRAGRPRAAPEPSLYPISLPPWEPCAGKEMVPRVACVADPFAESSRFPEDQGQGASIPPSAVSYIDRHAPCALSQERQAAKALFTTADGRPNALADKIAETISSAASRTAVTTDEPKATPAPGKAGRLMSKEEQARVKAAIANAKSVEEIRRLELELTQGFLPTMDSVGA